MTLATILDPWREVVHPAALILPRPSPAEFAALKASIAERGMLTPLAVYIDAKGEHWLLDGLSRLEVLVELGHDNILDDEGRWAVPTTAFREDAGADPYEIALSLNVARRHLSREQQRDVVARLLEERPDLSDRAIAKLADVSHPTVASVRHNEAGNGKPFHKPDDSEAANDGTRNRPETSTGPALAPERREASGRVARGRKPGSGPAAPSKKEAERQGGVGAENERVIALGDIIAWHQEQDEVAQHQHCTAALSYTQATVAIDAVATWSEADLDETAQQALRARLAPKISRGVISS